MKRLFIAICLVCMVGTMPLSSARSMTEPDPAWSQCSQDSDCIQVQSVCGGVHVIHQQHKLVYTQWRNEMAPRVNCTQPIQVPELHIYCMNQWCQGEPVNYAK